MLSGIKKNLKADQRSSWGTDHMKILFLSLCCLNLVPDDAGMFLASRET